MNKQVSKDREVLDSKSPPKFWYCPVKGCGAGSKNYIKMVYHMNKKHSLSAEDLQETS